MKHANRIALLGTETAFAVSAEAAAFAAQGKKMYPFHLGDMNIKTPNNIIDAAVKAMYDGKTGYCPNGGIPQLREALAADVNKSHGTKYSMENVSIQPGGKPVISKFLLTLMNPKDEVLYPNPGYPIYESQIEFYGGKAVPYGYIENSDNFSIDVDAICNLITPRTRLLILNNMHNPTGAECSAAELNKLAEIVTKHNLYVLCDEAYFGVHYEGQSHSFVSIADMAQRSIILYTFSKKYAMTGWRLGAAIGPKDIIDVITKINVNHESCTNHFAQYGAIEALTGDQENVGNILKTLKERRDISLDTLNSIPGVKCFKPNGTFYLYPNITEVMQYKNINGYENFRETLLNESGVSICTRLHFGRPLESETDYYIRFAYSGIDKPEIKEGLGKFKTFMDSI